jgi:Fic family protein
MFRQSPCGRVVPTIGGASAFVPDPLPPTVGLESLVPLISEASMRLGELNGIGRSLANPYILVRPFQRREAVASSGIEGTVTSLSELFLFEAGADERARPPDTREVFNYVRALEHSINRIEQIPVSLRLIREAHALLLEGVRRDHGAKIQPGEFRRDQNWIGGTTIQAARFVPPPPDLVDECLDAFEKFIHAPDKARIPPLIRLAMVHYQFETIHPFPDGNGRVGRLLIPLILYADGLLPQPLLYLSPYFERRYDEYIDRLYDVSRRGDWIGWFSFFLEGVVEQCRDTIARIQKLQDLHTRYRQKVQQVRSSALLLRLVDRVFEHPVMTIPQAKDLLDVTYPSAARNIQKLVEAHILAELDITQRPKFYMAHEVFEIIHEQMA